LLTLDAIVAHHDAGHFYPGSRLAYAELHRREVAPFGARVAPRELFCLRDHVIEPSLRIAYGAGNDAVATQCERRHAVDGTRIHRRPREAATASYVMRAESPLLRHEHILRSYSHAARRAHAKHLPVVHDLVLGPVEQAQAMVDDVPVLADRRREHIPVAHVDAAREVPAAAHHVSAIDLPSPALGKGDAGGDDRLGVTGPDLALRPLVVHREEI